MERTYEVSNLTKPKYSFYLTKTTYDRIPTIHVIDDNGKDIMFNMPSERYIKRLYHLTKLYDEVLSDTKESIAREIIILATALIAKYTKLPEEEWKTVTEEDDTYYGRSFPE